jgi:hypothetical protein
LSPMNLSYDCVCIQGPESSLEEVACQSSKGSIITTGDLYCRLIVIKFIQYMTTYMIQSSFQEEVSLTILHDLVGKTLQWSYTSNL